MRLRLLAAVSALALATVWLSALEPPVAAIAADPPHVATLGLRDVRVGDDVLLAATGVTENPCQAPSGTEPEVEALGTDVPGASRTNQNRLGGVACSGFSVASEASVQRSTLFMARWLVRTETPGRYRSYLLIVERTKDAVTGTRRTFGQVGRGRCRVDGESMRCRYSAPRTVSVRFVADELMETAAVTIRTADGFTHSVRWRSADLLPDGAGLGWEYCTDGGQGRGGGVGQVGKARGRVFGQRVVTRSAHDYAFLDEGAWVTQCADYEASSDVAAVSG